MLRKSEQDILLETDVHWRGIPCPAPSHAITPVPLFYGNTERLTGGNLVLDSPPPRFEAALCLGITHDRRPSFHYLAGSQLLVLASHKPLVHQGFVWMITILSKC